MKSQWVKHHWKVLFFVQRVSLADLMWLRSTVLMSTDLRWRLPTNTITNCRFSQDKPMTEQAQPGCGWIQRVSVYLYATYKSSFCKWEKRCEAYHSCTPPSSAPSLPIPHFLHKQLQLYERKTKLNKNFEWWLQITTVTTDSKGPHVYSRGKLYTVGNMDCAFSYK